MKKLTAIVLALALCLTMSVPAMAAEESEAPHYTLSNEVSGTWKLEFMNPDLVVNLVPDGTVITAAEGIILMADSYILNENGMHGTMAEEAIEEFEITDNGTIYYIHVYDAACEERIGDICLKAGEPDQANELICGVKGTTIKAKSSVTKKGKIKVSWTKSKGYSMDYYEVYRSLKKSSGYGAKPYYKTSSGKKTSYTNGKVDKGTTYYYRIRGVRTIEGKKYYTNWSNKTWKKAK